MSDSLQVIQVIRTRLERRGLGQNEDDPVRIIDQYWTMDGELLFEYDCHTCKVYSQVYLVGG